MVRKKEMFYLPLVHLSLLNNKFCYKFAEKVRDVLKNKQGWSKYGYSFVELKSKKNAKLVPSDQVMLLRLVPPSVLYRLYPQFKDEQLSVANITKKTVDFNSDRWLGTLPNHSGLPISDYQTYLVNHEVGHLLGKNHLYVSKLLNKKILAPIMIQQTKGIGILKPNFWPTDLDNYQTFF